MNPKYLPCKIIPASAALLFTASAQAAVYQGSAFESFDYTVATQLATLNGGVGFNAAGDLTANTTAWGQATLTTGAVTREITSASLDYTSTASFATAGNKVTLNPTGTATTGIGHNLGQTVDSGDFYFSFLSQSLTTSARTLAFTLYNGTNELYSVGQAGISGGATNSGGNIAITTSANIGSASLVSASVPVAFGNGVTHFFVGKIGFDSGGNETISLWLDPTDVSVQGAPYISTAAFNILQVTGFRIFAGGNSAGFPVARGNFDELRFGSTWESVTSAAAIPEPSTWTVLVGACAIGFAAIRRSPRRQAR